MGDVRFDAAYTRVEAADDPGEEIGGLSDEEVVEALAAASRRMDPYLANVLATAALNRMRLLKEITAAAGEGMYALDRSGCVAFVNPAAARMLGWTAEALMGKDVHDVAHLDERSGGAPRAACPSLLALAARGTLQHEEVFTRADGTTFPATCTSAATGRDREPDGVVVVFRDVTVARRCELERARREERQLRMARALAGLTRDRAVSGGDRQPAFRSVTEVAAATLEVERTSVWLFTDDGASIVCADLFQRTGARHSAGLQLTAARYPAYFQALGGERSIAVGDAVNDPRTREFADSYLHPLGIASMLDAMVLVGGRARGVVCNEHVGSPRPWTAEEEAFAGSVADLVAIALESEAHARAERALAEAAARFRQLAAAQASRINYLGEALRIGDREIEALAACIHRSAFQAAGFRAEQAEGCAAEWTNPGMADESSTGSALDAVGAGSGRGPSPRGHRPREDPEA